MRSHIGNGCHNTDIVYPTKPSYAPRWPTPNNLESQFRSSGPQDRPHRSRKIQDGISVREIIEVPTKDNQILFRLILLKPKVAEVNSIWDYVDLFQHPLTDGIVSFVDGRSDHCAIE